MIHRYPLNTILILYCTILSATINAKELQHPGGLHTQSQLNAAKTKINAGDKTATTAFKALIKQVDINLKRTPHAVVDYNVPGYYTDAQGHRDAMSRLSQDGWAAYSCAVAYQLTSDKNRSQYAEKTIQILDAWAVTNKKTSNADGDLAMADAGTSLIFAAELMTSCDQWTIKQRETFKGWIKNVYLPSCEKIVNRKNNWGDWGILGCIASYYFLDNVDALDKYISQIKPKIDLEIAADGSMPHETKRGKNGIWYTYFALAPLTSACQIALNARQIDLFHTKGSDGAGIEEALDYMLTYCHNPRSWPHYKKENLSLPTQGNWPGNLYEAMSGIYARKDYKEWIKKARPIMVYGHHYAWTVPTLLQTIPPHCTD